MIDYKTFKKEFLNEWVNRSQAARKAAEELAMKDGTSLRDKYRFIMTLNGKQLEFKDENEKKPDDPKYNLFTYDEAMERFANPDKDGWRLPSMEELELLSTLPYNAESGIGVFNDKFGLPLMGSRGLAEPHFVAFYQERGRYWSSTPVDIDRAWHLYLNKEKTYMLEKDKKYECSVRLVRDVN